MWPGRGNHCTPESEDQTPSAGGPLFAAELQATESPFADGLQKLLQILVAQGWTYGIFWGLAQDNRSLVWSDGCYAGPRGRLAAGQPAVEEVQLQQRRIRALQELQDVAGLAPDSLRMHSSLLEGGALDLADNEWFYFLCMLCSFPLGVGLPGRAVATRRWEWLFGANKASSAVCLRANVAKVGGIQTLVVVPTQGGVLELGTSELIPETPTLVQYIEALLHEQAAVLGLRAGQRLPSPGLGGPRSSSGVQPLPAAQPSGGLQAGAGGGQLELAATLKEVQQNLLAAVGLPLEPVPHPRQGVASQQELMALTRQAEVQLQQQSLLTELLFQQQQQRQVEERQRCLQQHRHLQEMQPQPQLGKPAQQQQQQLRPPQVMEAQQAPSLQQQPGQSEPPLGASTDVPLQLRLPGGFREPGPPPRPQHPTALKRLRRGRMAAGSLTSSSVPSLKDEELEDGRAGRGEGEPSGTPMKAEVLSPAQMEAEAPALEMEAEMEQGEGESSWAELSPSEMLSKQEGRAAPGGRSLGGRTPYDPMTHILTERRRREKLNTQFLALRAVVPKVSKMDKASVLSDAVQYVKELKQRIDELEAAQTEPESRSSGEGSPSLGMPLQIARTPTQQPQGAASGGSDEGAEPSSVEVRMIGNGALISVRSRKRRRLTADLLLALDSLNLETLHANISTFGSSVLSVFNTSMLVGSTVTPEEVVSALQAAADNPGGQAEPEELEASKPSETTAS